MLNWNAPAIGFYRALGARPMDEWTVYRIDDEPLRRLAALGPSVPRLPGPAREDLYGMSRFFRPHIARMAGYVPGEQPRDGGFIKLNTNENPYPPSPRVKAAIAEAVSDRLRLYPDPMATEFCRTAAQLHGVEPDMVLAGNGSDDLLTIVTRAFVGPGDLAAFATPSYLLYSTLVQLQDGRAVTVPYSRDWTLDRKRPGRPRTEALLPGQSRQSLGDRHAARADRRAGWRRSTAPCWSTRPTPISPTRATTACPCSRTIPT